MSTFMMLKYHSIRVLYLVCMLGIVIENVICVRAVRLLLGEHVVGWCYRES